MHIVDYKSAASFHQGDALKPEIVHAPAPNYRRQTPVVLVPFDAQVRLVTIDLGVPDLRHAEMLPK